MVVWATSLKKPTSSRPTASTATFGLGVPAKGSSSPSKGKGKGPLKSDQRNSSP